MSMTKLREKVGGCTVLRTTDFALDRIEQLEKELEVHAEALDIAARSTMSVGDAVLTLAEAASNGTLPLLRKMDLEVEYWLKWAAETVYKLREETL